MPLPAKQKPSLLKNLETGDRVSDEIQVDPLCGRTVSWMVGDVVTGLESEPPNGNPEAVHGDYMPTFDQIKFGYMDANSTDGSTAHLNGSTFATMVYSANDTDTPKPLCRGAPSANSTNLMLVDFL